MHHVPRGYARGPKRAFARETALLARHDVGNGVEPTVVSRARLILIAAVLALLAYLLVPTYFYVSADALVQGDLGRITPLYRARIDQLLVKCDDRVHKGQTLAVISNFLVQADYQQQYEKSLVDLNLSKIALDQGVAEARLQEETAHEKYVPPHPRAAAGPDVP